MATQSRPRLITWRAAYPFLLLSTITSLALNLSYQRKSKEAEVARLKAQISVLEAIVKRGTYEDDRVERELAMVGLAGSGSGNGNSETQAVLPLVNHKTTWREVFLGKKGKEWEEHDDTDWDKVFKEVEEAERGVSPNPTPAKPAPKPAPTPAPVSSRTPPPTRTSPASNSNAVYL